MQQYVILEAMCIGIVKARVHTWYDHDRQVPVYGVQVKTKHQPHRFFIHVLQGSGFPYLYDSKDEAQEFMEKLVALDIKASENEA